jgi:hypothetical protein
MDIKAEFRKRKVIAQDLAGETLIYDPVAHRAHCLNTTASAVWKCCDGKTTIGEMPGRLRKEFSVEADEVLVQSALAQLSRKRLVECEPAQPAPVRLPSRREAARRLSLGAAAAIPMVTSIVVPTPAMAQSGHNPGRRRRRRRGQS